MSRALFRLNFQFIPKLELCCTTGHGVKRNFTLLRPEKVFFWKQRSSVMSSLLSSMSRAMGKSSEGHMTREAAAMREKEKYLSMSINDKRKHYKCGKDYTTLDDVQTWEEYMKENRDRLLIKKRKRATSTGTASVNSDINKKVSIWRGDITTLEIDSIVNAANNSLLGGGGVDGAIHRGAGSSLRMECATHNGCDTGDAKITGGHKLPAKHVIHTVGPIGEHPAKLKSCYTKCLALVKENSLTSVAFPCISTGIYGYPNLPAAHIAIGTARKFLEDPDTASQIERIIFCLFLPNDVDIYEDLFQYYFPTDDTTDNKPNEAEEKQDKEEAESGTKKSESESKTSQDSEPKGEESMEAEHEETVDTKEEGKGDKNSVVTKNDPSEETSVETKGEESTENKGEGVNTKETATSAL